MGAALEYARKERAVEICCLGVETDHFGDHEGYAFVRLQKLQKTVGQEHARLVRGPEVKQEDNVRGGVGLKDDLPAASDKNKKTRLREKNRKFRKAIRDKASLCGYPLEKVQAALDTMTSDQQANLAESLRGVEVGSWVQTFEREQEVLSRT